MWFSGCAVALAFGLVANLATAAGLKNFEVPADARGPALKVAEWTPCAQPSGQLQLGPFALAAVRNCPVAGDALPLIVISHGFGGTNLSHHDTAETLADDGFIVVALNHPDDSAFNPARERDLKALISRPVDISRLIDFMLGPSPDAAKIAPQHVGFFGFSRGGYTGLVLAGARPDFYELPARCQDPSGPSCQRTSRKDLPTLAPSADRRIKAFVIADPLGSVFPSAENLKAVTAPIQLWSSERGGDSVSPQDVAAIATNLPERTELHIVRNSGHFAFLTVCPPELANTLPEICNDGAGFDRAAFHQQLDAEIVAFFRAKLERTAQR